MGTNATDQLCNDSISKIISEAAIEDAKQIEDQDEQVDICDNHTGDSAAIDATIRQSAMSSRMDLY